eukprot:tig00001024_g6334.t1
MDGVSVEEDSRSAAFEAFSAAHFGVSAYEELLELVHTQRVSTAQIHSFMSEIKRNYTELRMRVLREQIEKVISRGGSSFLLVGFPQDGRQAELVSELLEAVGAPLTHVLELQTDEDTCLDRSLGRLTHLPSGRSYHPVYRPPRVPGLDDVTGEPLVARTDDETFVVRERMRYCRRDFPPLLERLCGPAGAAHVAIDAGPSSGGVRRVVDAALAAVGVDPVAVDWEACGVHWPAAPGTAAPAAAPASADEPLDEAALAELMS